MDDIVIIMDLIYKLDYSVSKRDMIALELLCSSSSALSSVKISVLHAAFQSY